MRAGSGPGSLGLGRQGFVFPLRFIRPTSARLRLAALEVLAQGCGKARPLFIVCGWLATQGIKLGLRGSTLGSRRNRGAWLALQRPLDKFPKRPVVNQRSLARQA
ncbi:hypothetical protein BIWAKO_01144 [Bosea sp. BIWAKO-01]|nr:hypothetical protein BIWAKO_01144 [Bosea sp. BIWAKO-01]